MSAREIGFVHLTDLKTGQTDKVSIEDAARIAQLDLAEVEWALEEYGVCETDTHSIADIVI